MNETQREQTSPFYEFGPFRVDTLKYVLTRDGEVVPPRWSPDGTQILFYNSPLQMAMTPKVYVVGLDGQPPREVMADFMRQFGYFRVAWRPDGKHLSLWG